MTIGDVIKKYRKELGLTQQEMAERLGVTTPAVNKWEKGNTQPDISLLGPIARLLGITTDTLLSFRDELTGEEISLFIRELDRTLEASPYEEAFARAKEKIEEYPNCPKLILNMALILESHRLIGDISNKEDYGEQICSWYLRVLESEDETIRKKATESLYWFYTRQERYAEAEKYLAYFPADDPDKKRYQALIYYSTGAGAGNPGKKHRRNRTHYAHASGKLRYLHRFHLFRPLPPYPAQSSGLLLFPPAEEQPDQGLSG